MSFLYLVHLLLNLFVFVFIHYVLDLIFPFVFGSYLQSLLIYDLHYFFDGANILEMSQFSILNAPTALSLTIFM